jgi:hypothetical protein
MSRCPSKVNNEQMHCHGGVQRAQANQYRYLFNSKVSNKYLDYKQFSLLKVPKTPQRYKLCNRSKAFSSVSSFLAKQNLTTR